MNYILEDGVPVPVEDLNEWAQWFETHNRVLKQDMIGESHVSTVFLGIDHRMDESGGPPLVFETMIFGGPFDQHTWRYVSWAQAAAGHILISQALEHGEDPRDLSIRGRGPRVLRSVEVTTMGSAKREYLTYEEEW